MKHFQKWDHQAFEVDDIVAVHWCAASICPNVSNVHVDVR